MGFADSDSFPDATVPEWVSQTQPSSVTFAAGVVDDLGVLVQQGVTRMYTDTPAAFQAVTEVGEKRLVSSSDLVEKAQSNTTCRLSLSISKPRNTVGESPCSGLCFQAVVSILVSPVLCVCQVAHVNYCLMVWLSRIPLMLIRVHNMYCVWRRTHPMTSRVTKLVSCSDTYGGLVWLWRSFENRESRHHTNKHAFAHQTYRKAEGRSR
jgi:hypothetical protein